MHGTAWVYRSQTHPEETVMDFSHSERTRDYIKRIDAFILSLIHI